MARFFGETDEAIVAAWADLFAAIPDGWTVGRPIHDTGADRWSQFAFVQSERAKVGKRTHSWEAIHPTEIGVVRELARCLREISEGESEASRTRTALPGGWFVGRPGYDPGHQQWATYACRGGSPPELRRPSPVVLA